MPMLDIEALAGRVWDAMRRAQVPGLALAVMHAHETVYADGFGVCSVEEGGLPVTPQTLFRVASLTKPLTATLILRLIEAGKLALDVPVKSYVSWLRLHDTKATERVTLRMLLSHTSGLPTDHQPFGRRDPDALEERVQQEIPRYALAARPGERFVYSNVGFHLAGYIAEAVGGKPYATLMQEWVFDPLDMTRTTFDPLVALTYPTALAHERGIDGGLRVEHRFADNAACSPSGYVLTTAADLCRFARMVMRGGRVGVQPFLAPSSLAQMQGRQTDVTPAGDLGYGLGLFVEDYKGIRRVGHGGDIRSYGALFILAPDTGTAAIMLFNWSEGFFGTAETLVDKIFDELLGLPDVPHAPRWRFYAGGTPSDPASLKGG